MSVLNVVRTGYGLAQLITPPARHGEVKPGRVHIPRLDGSGQTVVRVLGSRHLVQAALSQSSPTSAVLALGAAVDLLHAASMVALAAADRRLRSAALAEGTVAFAFAVAGVRASQRVRRHPPPTATRALMRERDRWAQSLAHRIAPRLFPADGRTPSAQPRPLGGEH